MLDFTTNQTLQVYSYLLDMRNKQEYLSLKWIKYNWEAVGVYHKLKLEL